jgi:hypothetical protein
MVRQAERFSPFGRNEPDVSHVRKGDLSALRGDGRMPGSDKRLILCLGTIWKKTKNQSQENKKGGASSHGFILLLAIIVNLWPGKKNLFLIRNLCRALF